MSTPSQTLDTAPRSVLSGPEGPLIQTLSTLVRVPAVVGAESPFLHALERELVLHGATVRRYAGLLEAHGRKPDQLIVSAHVDQHGILCTGPNEFQYAAFVARAQGDLDGNSVSEQTAATIAERFAGALVESYDPWHGGYLGQATVRSTRYCDRLENLVFEIDGLIGLRPDTPLAYLQPLQIRDDALAAQLDNVLMVALIVDMFRRGFQGTALFAVEEEAGRSWRYIKQWFRRHNRQTKRLLVFDTSPYSTEDAARAQQIVLRRQDANAPFDATFVDELATRCADRAITARFKDEQIQAMNVERTSRGELPRSLGRTELGRVIAATDGTVNGATLQLPTTGYHTPNETVTLDAVRAAITLTDDLINA